jgi:hypothetical protein
MIHWLATNGFYRLLLIGEKKRSGGFQSEKQAEQAHWVLDRLEDHLPKDEILDASFDRMGNIAMRWPKGPLSPSQELLKQRRLNEEP